MPRGVDELEPRDLLDGEGGRDVRRGPRLAGVDEQRVVVRRLDEYRITLANAEEGDGQGAGDAGGRWGDERNSDNEESKKQAQVETRWIGNCRSGTNVVLIESGKRNSGLLVRRTTFTIPGPVSLQPSCIAFFGQRK
ncbi:MAG: hypothetical protein ABFC38_11900 [Methanospirillum sp.]